MSVAGQWDFSIKNGQLLKTLNTSGGNFSPREVSFMQPSLALITDKILFFESGNYKTSLGFTNIGDIDGETPSDLQDAYDKITDLIANFNLGGATPSLFDVLSVNDRPVNILEGASEAYTFQENDARKYLLQTQEFDFNIVADVLPENGMFFVKNISGSSREILADTGVTLIGMTPIIPNNGLAIIKQIVPNVFDITIISESGTVGEKQIKYISLDGGDYELVSEDANYYLYVEYPSPSGDRKIILPADGTIADNSVIEIFNNTGLSPLPIDTLTNSQNGFGGSFNNLYVNYKAVLKYGPYLEGIKGWTIAYEVDGDKYPKYLIYSVNIAQSGTDDPIIDGGGALENTIYTNEPTFSRIGAGNYIMDFTENVFPAYKKVQVFTGSLVSSVDGYTVKAFYYNNTSIFISCTDVSGTPADMDTGANTPLPIEIKVYP